MKKSILLIIGLAFCFCALGQTDKALAKVQKTTGKYIFTHCEPVSDYDVVFTMAVKAVWSNSQINSITKIENLLLKKAFKESEKLNKDFDAIIIGTGKEDIAIKFKE